MTPQLFDNRKESRVSEMKADCRKDSNISPQRAPHKQQQIVSDESTQQQSSQYINIFFPMDVLGCCDSLVRSGNMSLVGGKDYNWTYERIKRIVDITERTRDQHVMRVSCSFVSFILLKAQI